MEERGHWGKDNEEGREINKNRGEAGEENEKGNEGE